nr:polysaccharide pyruvyl transferase family protein [Luteimonas sp. MC1895]
MLFNTSFKNKGDALMNEAIVRELGDGHDWAAPASLHFTSRREARGYRVCLVSDLPGATWKQRTFNRVVSVSAALAHIAGPELRRRIGVCIVEDIDVAMDVSGYCYGDVWGQEKIEWGVRTYKRLHRAGACVILMPKTWGPFEKISKASVREMLRFVDLAFARDENSKSTLDEIVPAERSNVRFAPDYTHKVASSGGVESGPGDVAYVIPSYRVIDSGALDKAMYYRVLSDARRILEKRGLVPKLLIHESSNDLQFVDDVGELGFSVNDVVVFDDPVELKNAISTAAAVVTSRLHGLYNALNSAVPVAVVAWVFKYREALRQYGCEECLVDLTNPIGSLHSVLEMITDNSHAELLKSKMRAGKAYSDLATAAMWTEIRDLILPFDGPG